MSSIARLAEERQFEERIHGVGQGRRTAIDRLPFPVVEAGEAPERLADIHRDILSLTTAVSPQGRDCHRLGGRTDRGHGAKPMGARYDRIAAVEAELAAAVRGR